MSNKEYDTYYDELVELEKTAGAVSKNSPTQTVGYGLERVSKLEKVEHKKTMLSLDKTKSIPEYVKWLEKHESLMHNNLFSALLSIKADGITVVVTYSGGSLNSNALVDVVTRGDGGLIGERVTHQFNIRNGVPGLPTQIDFTGELTVRGEAIIPYTAFNSFNSSLSEEEEYMNPRNLCSGTVRHLTPGIAMERGVEFLAFNVVNAEGVDFHNSFKEQFDFLISLGFHVIPHKTVNSKNLEEKTADFKDLVASCDIPCDGLVLQLNDLSYCERIGNTNKFSKSGYALKFEDTSVTTTLLDVFWDTSRTGEICPVAVLKPQNILGSNISRATLHNVSEIERLELGIGDELQLIKSNLVIPKIIGNNTRSNNLPITKFCPICGAPSVIKKSNDTKTLYCTNNFCVAKKTSYLSISLVKVDLILKECQKLRLSGLST